MSVPGKEAILTPGDVAILNADEGWRRISFENAGLRRAENSERPFALSSDGNKLAIGDRRGIVILDFASGAFSRYPVKALEPVVLRWSADSVTVTFVERGSSLGSATGWQLDVGSGAVKPTSFDPWLTSVGARGRALEFVGGEARVTSLRSWVSDIEQGQVALAAPVRPDGPPVWGVSGAFLQRYASLDDRRAARGVVEFDPASGEFGAVLSLTPRQLRWATLIGWTRNGWLLIAVPDGAGGAVVAWRPERRKLVRLTNLDARGIIISAAIDRIKP